jgi:hypothetical protein
MDKRRFQRIKVRKTARIDGKLSMVNNISEEGMEISYAIMPKTRNIEVNFEIFGKVFKIPAVIRWIKKKYGYPTSNMLGISLKEPPKEFFELVKEIKTA